MATETYDGSPPVENEHTDVGVSVGGGEGSLHIAIVYGDLDMVKMLVESGADVTQRASGRLFAPDDQGDSKETEAEKDPSAGNYEGFAYYGEYPLAFAASFGHEEIYDYLIDHGGDPNKQDSFGNTVLHTLVINNQILMFSYAVKHHTLKANMDIKNDANLTPLTLASKLGRKDIFKEIIELQSKEIWRYSNITCSVYPLSSLDTIGPDGLNPESALSYITAGDSDEHLEMLDGGVMKQLLDDKWKTYAKKSFFMQCALAMMHLTFLSIAIYTRQDGELLGPKTTVHLVRYCAEIVVCAYCIYHLYHQIVELWMQGFITFIGIQANSPAKLIFNISCILILLCIPLRLARLYNIEMVFLAIAAPCAWTFLLFFGRGWGPMGPFVVMIYKMFATDILRFCIIFLIFLVEFSQGFYFLFKDNDNETIQTFKTPQGTVMQLFQMTLGEFKMAKGDLSVKYEDFDQTRLPVLTKMVFGVFAILVPILLLNMLIAMMGNTYTMIISRSEKEWKRQWAKIIMVLERGITKEKLKAHQEEYSVPMGAGCGLMVIKTSTKTKARQRKGAIGNWKRVVNEIKVLLKEAKKSGGTSPFTLTNGHLRSSNQVDLTAGKASQSHAAASQEDGGLMNAMAQLAWEKDIDLTTTETKKTTPGNGPSGSTANSKLKRRGKASKVSPSPEGSVPNSAGSHRKQDAAAGNGSDDDHMISGTGRQKSASSGRNNVNNNSSSTTQLKGIKNLSDADSFNSNTSLSKLISVRSDKPESDNDKDF